MKTILDKIVVQTSYDLKKRMNEVSFHELQSFEGFEKNRISFKNALKKPGVSVIAEVKKASPSKGIIRADFNPIDIALRYERGGASALSVLTDVPFFKGHLTFLSDIAEEVELPVLRKDFIIDPYQVKEARAFGADAFLIIMDIVSDAQLDELLAAGQEFDLDPLVECYNIHDFERVPFERVEILGVNNRDLHTFEVDVHRGNAILKQAPKGTILVSESGISNEKDIALLHKEEIDAVLIGEFFMRQSDPGEAVSKLIELGNIEFERIFTDE